MEISENEAVVKPEQKTQPVKTETYKLNEVDIPRQILLPSIEDLPEQYQERSKQNIELMNSGLQKITDLEPKADRFAEVADRATQNFTSISNEGADEQQSSQKAEELKGKLQSEIQTLLKVRKLLLEKGDASSVLEIDRKFELYKYGKAKNPAQWLQQLNWKRQSDYEKGKQDFTDYQWILFNNRVDGLTDIVKQSVGNAPNEISIPSANGWNLESPDFDKQVDNFEKDTKAAAGEYQTQHKNAVNSKASLQVVEKWLGEAWATDVNLATKWQTESLGLDKLKGAVNYQIRESDNVDKRVMRQVEVYKHNSDALKGSLLGQVLELGDKLYASIYESDLDFSNADVIAKGDKLESYIPLLPFCGTSLEEYKSIADLSLWLEQNIDKNGIALGARQNRLSQIKKSLDSLAQANKEFPDSQDLMWHALGTDILINKVIAPGLLLSRAEQMNVFGEANFASAKMKVRKLGEDSYELTQDFFPYSTSVKTLTREVLSSEHGSGNKQWFEEYNQVCFTRNFSYFGDNADMSLCFSKSSLLSDRQFMLADGWHIFDGDYQGNPESNGLRIDLNQEPNLLVVVKEKFIPTLKEKLNLASKDGKILGGSIGVDEWIEKHVVVVESMQSEEGRNKIKTEFYKRFQPKKQIGFFIPSGVSEPETPGVKRKQALVTYKTI